MIHRAVVLASGRGSNFEAMLTAIHNHTLRNLKITDLISNRPDAGAISIAQQNGIPVHVFDSKSNRHLFETHLLELLCRLSPDWILLAGFMLLLKPEVIRTFSNRILNIHPSLLPKFRGTHAQRQALEAGEKETGCTVHFVTEELDAGPIIVQKRLEILNEDTESSLSARLLPLEHEAYIEALKFVTTHKVSGDVPDNTKK